MWIGAEAGRHDIGVKHFQLFWSLKLCGVLIGADWDPSDNEKHTKLVSYLFPLSTYGSDLRL